MHTLTVSIDSLPIELEEPRNEMVTHSLRICPYLSVSLPLITLSYAFLFVYASLFCSIQYGSPLLLALLRMPFASSVYLLGCLSARLIVGLPSCHVPLLVPMSACAYVSSA